MRINSILQQINIDDIPDEFGVFQEVPDFDKEIGMLSCQPIIVNDIDTSTIEGKERLKALLITDYKGDKLPVLPTCDCGKWVGQQYVGLVCDECSFMVLPVTERPIESNVWIAAPEGVHGLINPIFWALFNKILTVVKGKESEASKSKTSILEWLVNPTYRPPTANLQAFDILSSIEMRDGTRYKRGLNNFYKHFDELMELVVGGKILRGIPTIVRARMEIFIKENRHKIFCKYIPIPNKLAIVMEHTHTGTYSQEVPTATALDAVRSISSIRDSPIKMTPLRIENKCVAAIDQLSNYYLTQIRESLSKKSGWNRKHGVGSRQDFSFRCVIASITEPHHHEEVHLPWSLSVGLFTVHLANYLTKDGLTPDEIECRLHWAMMHYDPEIDELFKRIIADSDDMGPAVIIQRNPTLSTKSAQLLQVTKIKTDLSDITMGVSVLCLTAWNADFDGRVLPWATALTKALNASNCWELSKVA